MKIVTTSMILVFCILAAAIVFLVLEWLPMEVVALLVLGSVAITGLVEPLKALSGFSNPAVITVWAVFILSSGLSKTGVANWVGRMVLNLSGKSEASIIGVIMVSAALMSAFMNNVAVAALMLPVTMDISRQTGNAPSRLMLPLAYGSLLGGLTTKIGTPPNLLVSGILSENSLKEFALFDFTPVGVTILVAGVLFMVLVGRHLLPRRNISEVDRGDRAVDIESQYNLKNRIYQLRIPAISQLTGKTIAETRIGKLLGFHIIGITRKEKTILSPSPSEILYSLDVLTVEGDQQQIRNLERLARNWNTLSFHATENLSQWLFSKGTRTAKIELKPDTEFEAATLKTLRFRNQFQVVVMAIQRKNEILQTRLQDVVLQKGDLLFVQGSEEKVEELRHSSVFKGFEYQEPADVMDILGSGENLMMVEIPEDSVLHEKTLMESRLGDALGIRALSIKRGGAFFNFPDSDYRLLSGDVILLEGSADELHILKQLSELEILPYESTDIAWLEGEDVGMIEAILHPHSKLAGKTLSELRFREKYGLSVLSIWRAGKAFRSEFLGEMAVQVGDALLLYGPRVKFNLLGREPDFMVLTESAQEVPNFKKAKLSIGIMLAVLFPVMMGWIPIYISAVIGAAFMVISGCLSMEEAHQSIEWKGIILIAGMLPLGTALESTGAAAFVADGVVRLVGPLGPLAVMGGLMALTFLATCVIPTAALVVLLGPIALNTAASMGISPYALMMAVAMASSASFMTPISHPANIMVMGPGGYRFIDYVKVGLPLTLTIFVVVMLVLPFLWPF
jgi:di/tricarboxylate transporter